MTAAHRARLAVDIGGTFTDVVLEMDDKAPAIDDAYVDRMLADIVGNNDLSRYIL